MTKSTASKPPEPPEPPEPSETPPPPPANAGELAQRMSEEVVRLGIELGEVELLITQATLEASRHETRRATASDKLTAMLQAAAAGGAPPPDTAELNTQLVLLTKRAALMDSQVDVLEGKKRALVRFRDGLSRLCGDARRDATGVRAGPGQGHRREAPRRRRRTRSARCRRPSPGCCSPPRRTCAARSPGRCTTDRPRA